MFAPFPARKWAPWSSKLWKNTKTHGTTIISIFYFIERLESIMAEMKDVFAKAESKMNKSIDHLMEEYAAIRCV